MTTPKSFPFTVEVIHEANPGDTEIKNFNFSLAGESKRQRQAATILNDISSADVR